MSLAVSPFYISSGSVIFYRTFQKKYNVYVSLKIKDISFLRKVELSSIYIDGQGKGVRRAMMLLHLKDYMRCVSPWKSDLKFLSELCSVSGAGFLSSKFILPNAVWATHNHSEKVCFPKAAAAVFKFTWPQLHDSSSKSDILSKEKHFWLRIQSLSWWESTAYFSSNAVAEDWLQWIFQKA